MKQILLLIYRIISIIVKIFVISPLFLISDLFFMAAETINLFTHYKFSKLDESDPIVMESFLVFSNNNKIISKILYCIFMPLGRFINSIKATVKSIKF